MSVRKQISSRTSVTRYCKTVRLSSEFFRTGIIPVELDSECPRGEYRTRIDADGRVIYRACGFPKPIPGRPPERNLRGLSFAVANVTGLLAAEALRR